MIYIYTYMHIYIYVYIRIYDHIRVLTHTDTHTITYIYNYIYTHTYTSLCSPRNWGCVHDPQIMNKNHRHDIDIGSTKWDDRQSMMLKGILIILIEVHGVCVCLG